MKREEVSVIDYSSGKIGVFVASKNNDGSFSLETKGTWPYDVYYKGAFLGSEKELYINTKKAFKQIKGSANKIEKAVIGVPDEFVKIVTGHVKIQFSEKRVLTQEDIDGLFYYADNHTKIENYVQADYGALYYLIDGKNKVYDAVGCTTSSIHAEVFFAYISEIYLSTISPVLKKLGVREQKFISSGVAQAKNLITKENRVKGAIIVDIGYLGTSVIVAMGEGSPMIYSIFIGELQILSDICKEFNIDLEQAKVLKECVDLSMAISNEDNYKCQVGEFNASQINEIVKCKLNAIIDLVVQSVNGLTYKLSSTSPLFLTGCGVSQIKGVCQYISGILGRKIVLLECNHDAFCQEDSSAFALIESACDKKYSF